MESLPFSQLLDELNKQISLKDKKAFIQTAATKNTFTCAEVAQLLEVFGFSKEKLRTLEILRPQISNRGNLFQIIEGFTFVKDKKRAGELLGEPKNVEAAVKVLDHTESSQGVDKPPPMKLADFSSLLDVIAKQSFPKEKLYFIELATFRNTFTSNQVMQLLKTLQFSRHKLKALSILHYRITDPENHFILLNAFTYHSDKKRATELLK